MSAQDVTRVSVVIPTRGEPALAKAVRSVLANAPAMPFEVIVSGPHPDVLLPDDERLRTVGERAEELASGRRNRGAAAATGDLLMFTDADCVADSNWIEGAVAAVCEHGCDAAGGGIRFPRGNVWDLGDNLAVFHPFHVSRRARTVETGVVPSNNLAVRREAFEAIGGFDEKLWIGEDWDFAIRLRAAGRTIRFDPRFAVRHESGRTTRRRLIEHACAYGAGYVKLMALGVAPVSRARMDRLPPGLAQAWAAMRAAWQTKLLFLSHPAFWRYAYAGPAVWLFYYRRRLAVCAAHSKT